MVSKYTEKINAYLYTHRCKARYDKIYYHMRLTVAIFLVGIVAGIVIANL